MAKNENQSTNLNDGMENPQNTGNNQNQNTKKEFVRARDMKIENLRELGAYAVYYEENKQSDRPTNFTIELCPKGSNESFKLNQKGSKDRATLLPNEWSRKKRKANKTGSFVEYRPVRFIKGVSSDGYEYYRWEVYLLNGLFKGGFISPSDVNYLNELIEDKVISPIDWVVSDQQIDDITTVNYDTLI